MRHRLLVVDDDEAVLRAYLRHFSLAGYEVHEAANARQAARSMEARPFDAVILDVCLTRGGAEGLRLARHLRRARLCAVVVLTSYGEPTHARAAARLGADAFLHKPVSLDWLDDLLRLRIEARRISRSRPVHRAG